MRGIAEKINCIPFLKKILVRKQTNSFTEPLRQKQAERGGRERNRQRKRERGEKLERERIRENVFVYQVHSQGRSRYETVVEIVSKANFLTKQPCFATTVNFFKLISD